jgi:hypothetical protein
VACPGRYETDILNAPGMGNRSTEGPSQQATTRYNLPLAP